MLLDTLRSISIIIIWFDKKREIKKKLECKLGISLYILSCISNERVGNT